MSFSRSLQGRQKTAEGRERSGRRRGGWAERSACHHRVAEPMAFTQIPYDAELALLATTPAMTDEHVLPVPGSRSPTPSNRTGMREDIRDDRPETVWLKDIGRGVRVHLWSSRCSERRRQRCPLSATALSCDLEWCPPPPRPIPSSRSLPGRQKTAEGRVEFPLYCPSSAAVSRSRTSSGRARPPVRFIVSPIRRPNAAFLPAR